MESTNKTTVWNVPKRYVIVVMVFFGYTHFFYLHTNIGMVVVDVTSAKDIVLENGTVERKPEYDWTPQQKALVLSSFAYGRLFCPIGGTIAGRLGGSTVYAIGILVNALITLLTPFFLHLNFYLFVITTGVTGIFESFSYVSVLQIWSRWTPPDERAKSISISVIGVFAGSIASFVVAGWILSKFGWETLFYTSGIASFAFFCIWSCIVKNDPLNDKCISNEEREYIAEKLNHTNHAEKLVYPWKDILTCMPFWAGSCCKFCMGGGYTFMMMHLPQYIKDLSDVDIEKIGYISVLPQICAVIAMPLAGWLSDYLRSSRILSVTNAHKLFISIGLFCCSITLLVAGLWSNLLTCVIFLCLFQLFSTFVTLDLQVLVLDLGPRYAALMHSFNYFFYTAACIFTPFLVGFFVTSHSQLQWSVCFVIMSGIFTCSGLLFLKFGSGELQPWANFTPNRKNEHPLT